MNYNARYYESLCCEPTTEFHIRFPYNILDVKLRLKPEKKRNTDKNLSDEPQKQLQKINKTLKTT